MNKLKPLLFLLLLTSLFIACEESNEVTLEIKNKSSDTCTEIYIRESGHEEWGENEISENLVPEDSMTTVVDKDKYDFLVKFSASEDTEYLDVDLSLFDSYDFNIVD